MTKKMGCIIDNIGGLSIGGEYEIVQDNNDNNFVIINDDKILKAYPKDYFSEIVYIDLGEIVKPSYWINKIKKLLKKE